MKKILSIALAICMVLSLSTVAFADASGYSTTVTYNGTGSSEWELNVPANMLPGESKDVTLEGTWDSSTVFNVSTDASVTMGNDINNDTETLAITFNTIEAEGNNYSEISIVEPISVADMPDVLFGNWKGVFNYYLTLDKVEVVDELEQDASGNYLVNDADDLFTLARIVNSGAWVWQEKTVLLTGNIDLENRPFTPIGYLVEGTSANASSYGFPGVFDGQGYTIYNLNVTDNYYGNEKDSIAGLFGMLRNATVKNLNIEGATVSSTHYAGVIAGTLGGMNSTIESCNVVDATVVSTFYNDKNSGDKAGVIAGVSNTTDSLVKDCTATNCTVTASRDAGQLVGAARETEVVNSTATNVEVKWNGVGTGANIRNELIGRVLN